MTQYAILVLVDTAAAVAESTLVGNLHLIDDTGPATPGQGGAGLVTPVAGTHWADGTQAEEHVLNWAAHALAATPRSVPRWLRAELDEPAPPVLASISGQAVDLGVILPARYGSPDPQTGGWYWSATVDTSRVGTWSYTIRIDLPRPGARPLRLTHAARICVTTRPRRNGFTGAGQGLLPWPVSPPRPQPSDQEVPCPA